MLPKWTFQDTIKRMIVQASSTNYTDFVIEVEFLNGARSQLYISGTSIKLSKRAANSSAYEILWTK